MRLAKMLLSLALFLLILPSQAAAVDEGETQPKLSKQSLVLSTLSADLVPLTNGSGNVKGVLCMLYAPVQAGSTIYVHFYVDGSTARTINLSSYPFVQDAAGNEHTEMIPMNIRFGSSIKIGIQRSLGTGEVTCAASWALD